MTTRHERNRLAPEMDDPKEDWMGWYGEFCDGMKAIPKAERGR